MTARDYTTRILASLKSEGYAPWRVGCGAFGLGDIQVIIRNGVRGASSPTAVLQNGVDRVQLGWDQLAILAQIRKWIPHPAQK